MSSSVDYVAGPASGAHIEKDGENWTLVIVRELRHSPDRVWAALTDPEQLREWAPYEVDGNLAKAGTVNFTWVGAGHASPTEIKRAEAPVVLEYGDMRWELEASGTGTRLKLWHQINRNYIAMGAAGWHICFDALDFLLAGNPIGRRCGPEMMGIDDWKRLFAEYSKEFGIE